MEHAQQALVAILRWLQIFGREEWSKYGDNQAAQGVLYWALGTVLVSVPIRFISKLVQRIPTPLLGRTSSPAIVTAAALLVCDAVCKLAPGINAVALSSAVFGGGTASILYRWLHVPVGAAADTAVDKVSAKVTEMSGVRPPPPAGGV